MGERDAEGIELLRTISLCSPESEHGGGSILVLQKSKANIFEIKCYSNVVPLE